MRISDLNRDNQKVKNEWNAIKKRGSSAKAPFLNWLSVLKDEHPYIGAGSDSHKVKEEAADRRFLLIIGETTLCALLY